MIPFSDAVLRIPLPFEFGALFGALPIAALEEERRPGSLVEAMKTAGKNLNPLDWPSLVAPIAEAMRNEDWKGDPIVPPMIAEWRKPEDQYTARTTKLAIMAGRLLGYSPAMLEHIANGYTAGLYRRLATGLKDVTDPSAMGGEPANLPIVGTLFLREGASRVVGDFYGRIAELKRTTGSETASLAEVGELAAAMSLSGKLSERWAEIRDLQKAGNAAAQREAIEPVYKAIQQAIRDHQAISPETHELRGAGKLLVAATGKDATPAELTAARRLLAGRDAAWLNDALRAEAKRQGWSTATSTSTGKTTTFGWRMARLKGMDL